ncbi:MAG: hypothetical protein WCW68_13295 [Methanothrix sp.]
MAILAGHRKQRLGRIVDGVPAASIARRARMRATVSSGGRRPGGPGS